MGSRNDSRTFRIRVTHPGPSVRFRNFVTLYGVNRLALALGVHPTTVQDWKHGRYLPSDKNKAGRTIRFYEHQKRRPRVAGSFQRGRRVAGDGDPDSYPARHGKNTRFVSF
jgi:hypothetical protein